MGYYGELDPLFHGKSELFNEKWGIIEQIFLVWALFSR